MPTIKQLHNIWSTQQALFGSNSVPQQAYTSLTEGHGLAEIRHTDLPGNTNTFDSNYDGEIIGEVKIDLELNNIVQEDL